MVAVPIERIEEEISQQGQIAPSSSHDNGEERVAHKKEEEAHVSLKTDGLDPIWVSSIKQRHLNEPRRLKVSSIDISCSIHRVPHSLHRHNRNAYDPQVISIGPFHYRRREVELQAMEEHKWKYLHDILSRSGEGSLERYLIAVRELEESARNCYSEVIALDSNSFVEMMVLDGCFIIELFRKYYDKEDDDDPICKLDWLFEAVVADLIMLENQIPFFIIQRLSNLIDISCSSSLLVKRALYFLLESASTWDERINNSHIPIQHLLHLVHTGHVLCVEENDTENKVVKVPSASKLEEVGIKFKKRNDVKDGNIMLNIKFQKGVIEIPPVLVWDETNIVFLNLIAFEQCYNHCKKYFIAYTTFMDWLINTGKDVEILCRREVIDNGLGNEEEVAALFNNMGREVIINGDHFYLSRVCNDINEYNERAWPKLRATLVHDYFKNPWAIISFMAALLLLLLTMTQAFFSSFPKFAYG
ncbi:hypothetical protein AAC387_Pa12g0626 [Persea americana]